MPSGIVSRDFNLHFGDHDQLGLNALTDLVLTIYYGKR